MTTIDLAPACAAPPLLSFSYLYLYVYVFDADVEAWQRFLRSSASAAQRAHDAPVVARLAAAVRRDPELPRKIREAVETIDDVAVQLVSELM